MPQLGLALFALAGMLVVLTGLPSFVVLLFVSVLGSLVGIASGSVPAALLGALPARLVGLLENDLLQAVPLFVLVGALLDRLPLADLLYRCGCRLGGDGPVASRVSAVGLSALLAPMNGSVGASVAMLSRVVAPRLRERGADPAQAASLVALSSTLGVLVPPSVVLLLLGDALMRAHTEALHLSGSDARVLNSQDLLRGVLVPAAMVLALVALIAAWQARRSPAAPAKRSPSALEAAVAACTVGVILVLLAGVALGRFYAVEAAAAGCALLLGAALLAGALTRDRLSAALRDALDITGSLFALFVAATTFTMVLHALGTDRWVAALFAGLPGGALTTVATALVVLLLSALVIDAFELIFVVVPILMPPVLARVDDALWVGVLALLALQLSFALPPLGYAVMMTSARIAPAPSAARMARALAPYLAALAAVLVLVLARPQLVHVIEPPAPTGAPRLSPEDVERLLREAPRGMQP